MQVITEGHSHGALLGAVLTHGRPGQEAHFLEMALAFIAIVEAWRRIVGHEEVQPSVAIEVRPDRAQAVATVRVVHAGFLGYVRERTVPVVVEEQIASTLQSSWTALHTQTAILTALARTKFGKVIEVEVHVMGDEQIHPAVSSVIPESGDRGKLGVVEPSLFGDIRK